MYLCMLIIQEVYKHKPKLHEFVSRFSENTMKAVISMDA